ncbi:MAG: S24 family peptidase [Blastocatellia bacterium]|nr:S24 family peptidase [Blastocatellia bacterium]
MSSEIRLVEGVSIKECLSDLGLEFSVFKTRLGKYASFEAEDKRVKVPADITGLSPKPDGWVVLELAKGAKFTIAAAGDMLAVRRIREPKNGQIAIIKHDEGVLIRRVFISGNGIVLRALDQAHDLLVLPSAVEIRGVIEGIALEGCWYKVVVSEKFPEK